MDKYEISAKIDNAIYRFTTNPIVGGLMESCISAVPAVGPAIISATNKKAFELFKRNTKEFADQIKASIADIEESKIDKGFLQSDEFVSILMDILPKVAKAHSKEKVRMFSDMMVATVITENSGVEYKEGFFRIVDELGPVHIQVFRVIHTKCACFTPADRVNKRDYIDKNEIVKVTHIESSRIHAYCAELTRFGVIFDVGLGSYGYSPTNPAYDLTEYGREFARFLMLH